MKPPTKKQLTDKRYRATIKGWLSSKITNIKRHERKNQYKSDVTRRDIKKLIVENCPALGYKLAYRQTDTWMMNLATIDRIDSSKGYMNGNLQILSFKANAIKGNATREELVAFSKWVLGIKQ